jgi:AAA+ ATPase superfamily predicted ATPase
MNSDKNPFHLKGYNGPLTFCDRKKESRQLIENINNDINTTLSSIRRMGKTGLIHHVFHSIAKEKSSECIYIDIYATQTLAEFTNYLTSAILNTFPQSISPGKKFINLIKGLNPVISYDALTGTPEVSFVFSQQKQNEYTLKEIFTFLEQQKKQVVVAIDEFQQIANYPETNTEALLRTIIQPLNNVNFIFSGSQKHLLLEMFNSVKRPFFSSTNPLHLGPIPPDEYAKFIRRSFERGQRIIDDESIDFILDWTCGHTYYTQALCNKIYSQNRGKITIVKVLAACDSILQEQENIFYQYRNLLTTAQWRLLSAIACEGRVSQPTGIGFVGKYSLGNPASVKRSLEALVSKEMVLKETDKSANHYRVYDCFLRRWLER